MNNLLKNVHSMCEVSTVTYLSHLEKRMTCQKAVTASLVLGADSLQLWSEHNEHHDIDAPNVLFPQAGCGKYSVHYYYFMEK